MKRPIVIVWTARAWLITAAAILAVAAAVLVIVHTAVRIDAPLSDAVCGKTIAIDPGHGGADAGARGRSGLLEKDAVLDIGLQLAGMFNRIAVYTVMTRDKDEDLGGSGETGSAQHKLLDLESRVELASRAGADLYISIHANSFPEPVWSGAQTFYHSKSEESKALAMAIQKELVARLGPNLRKAKTGDEYFVLRKSKMPAVLVEVGFLSNPREEALLGQPDYRRRISEAVFHGTVNYLVDLHKRRKVPLAPETRPASDLAPGVTEDEEQQMLPSKARAALKLAEDEAVLYFAGPTNFDDGLMPEVRKIPGLSSARSPKEHAARIVQELLKGPAGGSVLCPTVPRGTRLRSVELAHGVAYVNFSRELAEGHWGGSRTEELTVYSIVNTLAEMPEVEKVQILIEGGEPAIIAGHIILDEPLWPNFAIVEERPS